MKLILVLTSICIIAGLFLGLTYSVTIDKIKYQEEMAEKRAISAVLPNAKEFSTKISVEAMEYYKGFDSEGNIVGYAFIGEGKGYSSKIRIMIGIDTAGGISGIKIISQQETPGLGSKIREPWFQEQFKVKGVDKVDTITGATITSKAVKNTVKDAIEKMSEVAPRSS